MDIQNLVKLRNDLVNAPIGELLLVYLQDYITSEACKQSRNAESLKGMCEIVNKIKCIPREVENKK